MTFVRRGFCGLVASVIAGTIGCSLACAQTDNVKPLRFVVPCPEGSPADALARAFAQILSKDLGRNVYVIIFRPLIFQPRVPTQKPSVSGPLRCDIRLRRVRFRSQNL